MSKKGEKGRKMQKCLVKITTEIDGNVAEVCHMGSCIFCTTSAKIVYTIKKYTQTRVYFFETQK